MPEVPAAEVPRRHCLACGQLLRKARDHNLVVDPLDTAELPLISDATVGTTFGRQKPIYADDYRPKKTACMAGTTADCLPPTWGDYGDNLVCGLRCGWLLAIRLAAAVGVDDLARMLPPDWKAEPTSSDRRVPRVTPSFARWGHNLDFIRSFPRNTCPGCGYRRRLNGYVGREMCSRCHEARKCLGCGKVKCREASVDYHRVPWCSECMASADPQTRVRAEQELARGDPRQLAADYTDEDDAEEGDW